MLWKFAFTSVLAFLWLLASMDTAEARYIHEQRHVHKVQEEMGLLPHNITPTAAFVGVVPASTFPVCYPPVFSAAPVVLFLLQPSTLDEPALIVGQARCARMTRYGATKSQLVPLFFVVFPGRERREVNTEINVPLDEPLPSQFVPGRMDAGHSIG
jgi:hypothetical protein